MKKDCQFFTVDKVCELTHLSRSGITELIKKGELKATKVGKRILVNKTDFEEWILSLKPIKTQKQFTPKGWRTVSFNMAASVLPVLQMTGISIGLDDIGMAAYAVCLCFSNILLRTFTNTEIGVSK